MKIALCQINTTVADLEGNARRIVDAYSQATSAGADLVLFPELAIPGYPPLDLLDRSSFHRDCETVLEDVARQVSGPPAVVGTIRRNASSVGRAIHNTAAFLSAGRIEGYADKALLPTYDVFDEERYFEPGVPNQIFDAGGCRVGIAICEDLWNLEDLAFRKRYPVDPAVELRAAGAELILCPSASPFHRGKVAKRQHLFQAQAQRLGVPVVLCNLVGGNTELVFDGHSLVAFADGTMTRAAGFQEDLLVVDLADAGDSGSRGAPEPGGGSDAEQIADALVLGVRDYFSKCGFSRAVVGLSGGIDSAVTTAVACEALGSEAVRGLAMPSRYSSPGSVTDAQDLAERLGIPCDVISIESVFESYLETLAPLFEDLPTDVTEENLQARIRGALLMAVSNKFGSVVLTTGNKSELAVGYCTIYGDMCGGLAVLGDVPKTDVYRISRLPRFVSVIPESTITKPPSAELRPDQKDEDSLPDYAVLDAILEAYVEESVAPEEISVPGADAAEIARVVQLVERNEYKRRQAAPTLRVTPRAFGMGRRFPIARRI